MANTSPVLASMETKDALCAPFFFSFLSTPATIASSAISCFSKSRLVIIFNPPYLPEDKREDAESARNTSGGKRGDEIILRFLKDAGKHLNTNGAILLIVSSLTPKNRILSVLRRKDLKKKIITEKKIFMESLEVWKIGRKLIF